MLLPTLLLALAVHRRADAFVPVGITDVRDPKAIDWDARTRENIAGTHLADIGEGALVRVVRVRPHRCPPFACSECGTLRVRPMTDAERARW